MFIFLKQKRYSKNNLYYLFISSFTRLVCLFTPRANAFSSRLLQYEAFYFLVSLTSVEAVRLLVAAIFSPYYLLFFLCKFYSFLTIFILLKPLVGEMLNTKNVT